MIFKEKNEILQCGENTVYDLISGHTLKKDIKTVHSVLHVLSRSWILTELLALDPKIRSLI